VKDLVGQYFPVLDFGFVSLKDFMGSDKDIEEMARVSYQSGTRSVSDTRGLIRYLMSHSHSSPMERCEIVLHMGLPIFVARQIVRHRTASLNEYSGRYSVMPNLYYTPTKERCTKQSATNKQGSSPEQVFDDDGEYGDFIEDAYQLRSGMTKEYKCRLEDDMARELCRIDLPLSTYTYWYWKIDLHNLLHFLNLRLDEHAQWETRQYAQIIAALVQRWLPLTWEAFVDYKLGAVSFSYQERQILNKLISSRENILDIISLYGKHYNLTNREQQDFIKKINNIPDREQYNYKLPEPKNAEYYQELISKNSHGAPT